jgi:hypothetical protein
VLLRFKLYHVHLLLDACRSLTLDATLCDPSCCSVAPTACLACFALVESPSATVSSWLSGSSLPRFLAVVGIALGRPLSRVLVVNCGGTIPRPMHASLNFDQCSMLTIDFCLDTVSSKSNGPTKVPALVKSTLSEYTVNLSGYGLALGDSRMRRPNYGTPSAAISYSCHSGHHRLSGSLRAMSFTCLAMNSTV